MAPPTQLAVIFSPWTNKYEELGRRWDRVCACCIGGGQPHRHPRGPESFFIIEGSYTFVRGSATVTRGAGEAISIPTGTPHRYAVGPSGGRAIVICPPGLEHYFQSVSELLQHGALPIAEEFAIASRYGQDFLDGSSHWAVT